jgi:predicted HicB family RNase H-like nuclease
MTEMKINGFEAKICFVPDMQMFRGEFINLNGGADFTPPTLKALSAKVNCL